jgi:hypothetical protein
MPSGHLRICQMAIFSISVRRPTGGLSALQNFSLSAVAPHQVQIQFPELWTCEEADFSSHPGGFHQLAIDYACARMRISAHTDSQPFLVRPRAASSKCRRSAKS